MLNFRLDVYIHQDRDGEILTQLAAVSDSIAVLAKQGAIMAGELQRLQTEVTEMSGVVDSAIGLINGLAQQIRDLANDPAALTAMADELDAKAAALADAVVANTPTPTP